MSGFEVIGAVAAGLQIAEQAFKIGGRIRKKIRDAKELARLKGDCDEAITQLAAYIGDLSPGATAAAQTLQNRLRTVSSNIDKVGGQQWYMKLANLRRVWNADFAKDLAAVTEKFRSLIVLEANKLLHSIKMHQDGLEFCMREKAEEVIQRVERIPDVVTNLLRSELAEHDLPHKIECLDEISQDLKYKIESLQKIKEESLALFQGISRIEEKVNQTNQHMKEQRMLLEDLHSTVSINFRQIIGTAERIAIPRSSSLNGPPVTYRSYAEYTVSRGLFLPEDEIWDAIRDIIVAMLKLKEMGYKFSKRSDVTNLRIHDMSSGRVVNFYDTFWMDRLGECKLNLIRRL